MFGYIVEGTLMMLNPLTLLYMAAGVGLGIVVGALPGLTTALAMALFTPLTFFMSPMHGIPFLLGLYKGGMYGGSIVAVLLNTPGTAAAAATMIDGFPLAQQGKAGKALRMTLYGSTIGSFFGGMFALFAVGAIAQVVLLIGRPDFFFILLFSVTIVSAVSGNSIWRGLVAGALGLFLSTVGLDPIAGTHRFTFGSWDLAAGLSMVPVMLGLFGLSEVFTQAMKIRSKKQEATIDVKSLNGPEHKLSFKEFWASRRAWGVGCIVGTVIGVIPGLNQPIAAFLSYAAAKKVSKRGANFGKGELDGVAAPETATNAINGGSLVPMLTLGIPGDVVTAVLLGAFVAQGLRPGPFLFQDEPILIYGILGISVIGNIFLLLLGWVAIKQFVKILKMKQSILFPVITTFLIGGAFAVGNNPFDVLVMVVFGVIGFGMRRADIPLAPLIITFILGRMIETSLLQSLLLHQHPIEMLGSPVAIVMLGMTVMMILLTVFTEIRKARKAKKA